MIIKTSFAIQVGRSSPKLVGAIALLSFGPNSLELLKFITCNIKINKASNCGKGEELTSWCVAMCNGKTST
jgi:hypothetical protein